MNIAGLPHLALLRLESNATSALDSFVSLLQNSTALAWLGIVLTIIGITIAGIISHRQTLILSEHKEISKTLGERVFGNLTSFEQVEERAHRLLELANDHPDAEVGVMVYWLWFGADGCLYRQPELGLEGVTHEESRVFEDLFRRLEKNGRTTVVMFDPVKAAPALKEFLTAAFTWQLKRSQKPGSPAVDPNGEAMNKLLDRYRLSLEGFEHIRASGKQILPPPALKQSIPMLAFAALGKAISHGIVFLGETTALEEKAAIGGFYTEERQLVGVILDQIKRHAK